MTRFPRLDTAEFLRELRDRPVNYRPEEVRGPGWNVDERRFPLPPERPGPPEPGGVWEVACGHVTDYTFSPPELVRAAYDRHEPLLGRTMVLEGRFWVLRLYLGVRVTAVVDERRAPDQRVRGFSYETLSGHLEQGRLSYEVVKHEHSGHVEFVIAAYSRDAPSLGPVLRLGWSLFGRRRQLRFYSRCGARMQQLARAHGRTRPAWATAGDGSAVVLAPPDARHRWWDRLALHDVDPG